MRNPAADAAGVRMLPCDTLLRTLLVWGCYRAIYPAADAAGVRMLPCDTLLRTVLV